MRYLVECAICNQEQFLRVTSTLRVALLVARHHAKKTQHNTIVATLQEVTVQVVVKEDN